MCAKVACHISLERFWQELKPSFKIHLNRRSTEEVMVPQNFESPDFESFKTPYLGALGQNDIWMQPPWLITNNIIRGKVMVPPKFNVVSLVNLCMVVAHPCIKNAPTANLFGLCKFMWIIDPLIIRPSPYPRPLARPSTPQSATK
jgi:hypothetical protein